jgi:hypothetical protein
MKPAAFAAIGLLSLGLALPAWAEDPVEYACRLTAADGTDVSLTHRYAPGFFSVTLGDGGAPTENLCGTSASACSTDEFGRFIVRSVRGGVPAAFTFDPNSLQLSLTIGVGANAMLARGGCRRAPAG